MLMAIFQLQRCAAQRRSRRTYHKVLWNFQLQELVAEEAREVTAKLMETFHMQRCAA